MKTAAEWKQEFINKIGANNFRTIVLGVDGACAYIGNGKCPECGKDSLIWYVLPHDQTDYASCNHSRAGMPK